MCNKKLSDPVEEEKKETEQKTEEKKKSELENKLKGGKILAYKSDEFYKVNGFIDHMKIRSGDDDLFINQASNKENTTICIEPISFTYSDAKTSFSEWFNQKRRHISTAKYYKGFDQFKLGLFYLTQLFTIILGILLLVLNHEIILVVTLITFRYLICYL